MKQASRTLYDALSNLIDQRQNWTKKEETQAEVEVLILDNVFASLPDPPFTAEEKTLLAQNVYHHVWQLSDNGTWATA